MRLPLLFMSAYTKNPVLLDEQFDFAFIGVDFGSYKAIYDVDLLEDCDESIFDNDEVIFMAKYDEEDAKFDLKIRNILKDMANEKNSCN